MADHPIHNPKDYSEVLRQILTTDPVHADTLNPLFERLLNNDVFIKVAADKVAADLLAHIGAADPHPSYLLKSGGNLTGNIAFQDLLEGIVLAAGGKIVDQGTGTVINAAEGSLTVTDETGATSLLSLSSGVFKYLNNVIHHAGNHGSSGDPHAQYVQKPQAATGNWNDYTETGLYKTTEVMQNQAPGHNYGSRLVMVIKRDDSLIWQISTDATDGGVWYRKKALLSGQVVWSAWRPMGYHKFKEDVDTATKDATTSIYKVSRAFRPDGTLYRKATLSNPNGSGYFQTETIEYYNDAGTTVIETEVWTLAYDTDGILTSRTPTYI